MAEIDVTADPPLLAGQGASIDTTTASGKLVFALFAAWRNSNES